MKKFFFLGCSFCMQLFEENERVRRCERNGREVDINNM